MKYFHYSVATLLIELLINEINEVFYINEYPSQNNI